MKKYCVDIDDTLLYSEIDDQGEYKLQSCNVDLIKKLNSFYENGDQVILFTARHWNHLSESIRQLAICGVKYTTIVHGKPVADYYIDDKGIKPNDFIKL